MKNRGILPWFAAAVMAAAPAGCNTLQSIEVSREPDKIVYGQGQALKIEGLLVTARYKKGNTEEAGPGGLRFTGYEPGKTGEQTVTVTMKGKWPSAPKSADFTVNVVPAERITVERLPYVTFIRQGADFNPSGLAVRVEFQNGAAPAEIVGAERLKLSGYNRNAAGTQSITADYWGKRVSFDIKVAAVLKIAVASLPDKTEYFTGEDFDPAGLVVYGTYEGFGDSVVNITRENISGFDKYSAGEQDLTVTWQGKTAVFPVSVVAMSAIRIDNPPRKLDYGNGEQLDLAGMSVTGTRQGSSSMELIDVSRLQVSGYERFLEGSQKVTVTVGGRSASFTVRVGPDPFTGTWRGMRVSGRAHTAEKPDNVTLRMSGDAWALTVENVPETGNAGAVVYEFSGIYTRDEDTGKHASLKTQWSNAPAGYYPSAIDVVSFNTLKITGQRSYFGSDGITLTRDNRRQGGREFNVKEGGSGGGRQPPRR